MKILRKISLPHLPIEDPLPSFKEIPEKSRWHQKSIEQQILAQDLEYINNAIAELRQKQEILQRRRLPLSNVLKLDTTGFKPHLPLTIKSPENIPFFEEELAGVDQALADLKTKPLGIGKQITDIPPMPPKPCLYPITDFLIQEEMDKLPLKQELAVQNNKDEIVKKVRTSKKTKSLLDRLQFGVIELQEKWAEVKGNLEKLEYPSPQVRYQLSRLDSELTKFEKASAESRTSLLDYKSQKRVTEEFKQILARINQQPVIPYELFHLEKRLRESPQYPASKIRLLRFMPSLGRNTSLSKKQQKRIHQLTQEMIANLSKKELKDFELLNVEKNLRDLPVDSLPEYKISRISPPTHGHTRDLAEKQIKFIHGQTRQFLNSLEDSIELRNYNLMQVNKNIADTENLEFSGYKVSYLAPAPGQVSDLAEKRIKTIHQQVEKILNSFEIPRRTAQELDQIKLKLSEDYLIPKAEIRDILPITKGHIRELSEQRRRKARKEIKKSLSQIKKNWRTDQRLKQIKNLMKKPISSQGRLMTKMTSGSGSISELPLYNQVRAHREINTLLKHPIKNYVNRNKLKNIQKKIKKGYLPPPVKIMNKLSVAEGKVKDINFGRTLQQMIQWHKLVKERIKRSKRYQYRTKEVKNINQLISNGILIKPVKHLDFSPMEGIPSPLPKKTREKVRTEVQQIISRIKPSSEALIDIEKMILEKFEPSKVKIRSRSAFKPLAYDEKTSYLKNELQWKKKSVKDEPVKITPEMELINKKLFETKNAKLQKNKVMQKLPHRNPAESRRLKKEFREIQTIIAKSFRDPTILLGKFRKRSSHLEETEKKARREVFKIMKRIEGENPPPPSELLQVEKRLNLLNNIPLEKGKIITRSSGKIIPSVVEKDFLQQELNRIKEYQPNIVIKKTKELLEIESKLARIYAS